MNIFSITLPNINLSSEKSAPHVNKYRPAFTSAADCFIKAAEPATDNFAGRINMDAVNKLFGIFKSKAENAPKNIALKIAPSSGQIMGFSIELRNGNTLEAIKNFVHKCSKNFFFISLKEMKAGQLKSSFGIDMESKDIVKLNRKGQSKVQDFELVSPDSYSRDFSCYNRRLTSYMDEIFEPISEKTSKKSAEVMKRKASQEQQAKKITIDDLLDEDTEIPLQVEELSEQEIFGTPVLKPNKKSEIKKIKIDKPRINKIKVEHKPSVVKKPAAMPEKQPKSVKLVSNELDLDGIKAANIAPDLTIKSKPSAIPGNLPQNVSEAISDIENSLVNIITFLDKNKGNFVKIKSLKENYLPLSYNSASRQKVLNFKLDNNATLGVIHTKTSLRFTRFIYKDSEGNESHLLVDRGTRVVKNLNKKKPWIVPTVFKYMTPEQIEASNIDKYVVFIQKELKKYSDYLKANL